MTDQMPERIDLATTPQNAEKIAELRQLFPEAFTEGKIDFEALRRSLGDVVDTDPTQERFGLRWPGKSKLQKVINQPSVGTLVPQLDESVDWETTQNLIIEGDNLEVLKLLQKSYAGKVKMIYIDPPYNTGNDFVYPDNFTEGLQTYLEFTGQIDGKGRKMQSNTETTGRYHANWLNMMYPRLYLARNLLREDGVIFVSIDDHEIANLRALMNEVFGEDQFVVQILWKKRSTPPNDQIIGANHDYILCYSRDDTKKFLNLRQRSDAQITRYKNPDNHPKGPWAPGDLMANVKGGRYVSSLYFPIQNPKTGEEHYPSSNGNWRFNRQRIEELLAADEISFGESGEGRPKLKRFLSDVKEGVTYSSIWDFVPLNTSGSGEMQTIFGDPASFESPKPSGLISELIALGCTRDGLVLDFFAGSGTTAHAVMNLNVTESQSGGGTRRFILVQLPEPLDEPKTLADGTTLRTIADITRERVRRAGRKIREEHAGAIAERTNPLDTGFRAYKLAPSNFRPWDGAIPAGDVARQLELAANHIEPAANDDALLAELLLRLGYELTVPVVVETVAGKQVYSVDRGALLICLEREITLELIEHLAERMPSEIICLDTGFANDQTKVNAGQIIASHARDEETSIAFKVV